ncbi:MAG: hypothetical protein H7246_23630 [Phycisphaerae bacterium]|nr:hypothetical protein [Saprospiraceae bacterium]
MIDNASSNSLPEWISKLSDEEKHELIAQIADSIQSPAPASEPQKASRIKSDKKGVPDAKPIPEHIQKYIRPRREKTDLQALMLEQGYTGTNWERFDKLVKELNIQEPIELLLSQLTR